MKARGFTLIELLAVIVILAIIALIAVPIVLNIINDSRESSNKRSVELYGKAVENAIAKAQLTGEVPSGNYTQSNDGKTLTKGTTSLTIEYSGSKVECTTNILYEDGKIYLAGCKVGNDTKEYTYGTSQEESNNEVASTLCHANTTRAQAYVYQPYGDTDKLTSYALENVGSIKTSASDAYNAGVAYTCNFVDDNSANDMIFFVLGTDGNNVTLISGSNLGSTVAWSSDGSNHKDDLEQQAGTAKAALELRTATWTKLNQSQIKLPTKAQIEAAYTGSMPAWLRSHTTDNVAYGYWTASPNDDNSNNAWDVNVYNIDSTNVNDGSNYGVRPVITISKSLLD